MSKYPFMRNLKLSKIGSFDSDSIDNKDTVTSTDIQITVETSNVEDAEDESSDISEEITVDTAEAENIDENLEQVELVLKMLKTQGYTKNTALLCEYLGIVNYAREIKGLNVVGSESLYDDNNEAMIKLVETTCNDLIKDGNESLSKALSNLLTKAKVRFKSLDTALLSNVKLFKLYTSQLSGNNTYNENYLNQKYVILNKTDCDNGFKIIVDNLRRLKGTVKELQTKVKTVDTAYESKLNEADIVAAFEKYNSDFESISTSLKQIKKPHRQSIVEGWADKDLIAQMKKYDELSAQLRAIYKEVEETLMVTISTVDKLMFGAVGSSILKRKLNGLTLTLLSSIAALDTASYKLAGTLRRVGKVYTAAVVKK